MSPPDTAKHWALFILLEDGKFEAMVAKLTAADLSTWTKKSRLTAVEIESKRALPSEAYRAASPFGARLSREKTCTPT